MNKKQLKNLILVIAFVVLSPVILLGLTGLGNMISGKGQVTSQTAEQKTEQKTEQKATVPTENKTTNTEQSNIPKSNENKVTTNESDTNVSTDRPVAGGEYTVKSGDSLFSVATLAYGENNSQAGINKIREANNMENDNLNVGQKIQIPKL